MAKQVIEVKQPDPETRMTAADKAALVALINGLETLEYGPRYDAVTTLRSLVESILEPTPVSEQQVLLMIVHDPKDDTMQLLPNNGDPVAVSEYAMVTAHPDKGEVHFRSGKAGWDLVRVSEDQPDSTQGDS